MVLSDLSTRLGRAPVLLLAAGALAPACGAGAAPAQETRAAVTSRPEASGFFDSPRAFPNRPRAAPLDSLARADILSCLAQDRFRLVTFSSGSVRGFSTREDLRGLYVTPLRANDGRERFVAWSDIRRVELFDRHPGSRSDGFRRGSGIGLAIGVVTILLTTRSPGDFGDLVYPLAVAIAALPFALVGGWIGTRYPPVVTGWVHCWP